LDVLHLPVPDLNAPSRDQFQQALAFIDWHLSRGRGVAVHCLVGQGRTGTVLCAYLIRGGQSVAQALAAVRAVCPGAVGSLAQERALEGYAQGRDWFI
jgi:atypical dual specificity phosphatase